MELSPDARQLLVDLWWNEPTRFRYMRRDQIVPYVELIERKLVTLSGGRIVLTEDSRALAVELSIREGI